MSGAVEGVVECVLIIPDVKAIIIVHIVLHISTLPSMAVGWLLDRTRTSTTIVNVMAMLVCICRDVFPKSISLSAVSGSTVANT